MVIGKAGGGGCKRESSDFRFAEVGISALASFYMLPLPRESCNTTKFKFES